jgi:hypothetical protein
MSYDFQKKIVEAADFLGTPKDASRYLILRIRSGFCCSAHCPNTWKSINEYLSPWGTLDKRKRIKVEKYETTFVYEHHETGAEIIAYLALGTACLSLVKSIVDLIKAIIDGMKKDSKTKDTQITIVVQNSSRTRSIFVGRVPLTIDEREALVKVLRNVLNTLEGTGENHKQLLPDPVVVFALSDHNAKSAKIAGEFSKWEGMEMNPGGNGEWSISLILKPGTYQYKFIVDGDWRTDPRGIQMQDNQGNWNSVVQVD